MSIKEPKNNYSMAAVMTEALAREEFDDFKALADISYQRYGLIVFIRHGKEVVYSGKGEIVTFLATLPDGNGGGNATGLT